MFWGLILEPGKRYTTTVEKSFHVSMAALDCTTVKQDQEIMSVMLETEGQESLLCNLCKQKGVLQEKLDLNFLTGETVTFTCRGNGTIHLSGYLVSDDDDELGEMGEEEEDDEEVEEEDSGVDSSHSGKKKEIGQKRKNAAVSPQQNKKKKVEAEEESDEDDESSEGEEDMGAEEEGESDEGDSDEMSSSDEGEDDDDDEDEDANVTNKLVSPQENKSKNKMKQGGQLQQQNQKVKSQQNTPNKPQQQQTPGGKGNKTPMANGFTPQQQQQSGKKDKKKGGGQDTPGQNKTPNQQKTPGGQKTPGQQQTNANTPKDKSPGGGNEGTPQKRVLEGGVVVKELRQGNGPIAKTGRLVTVYYTGKLKSNNKVFDATTEGAGFKFRLGRGEVIKGWDVGVAGMKVGSKRLIICPPNMAYGSKGSQPHIPPNSSLVFEVELKAVN